MHGKKIQIIQSKKFKSRKIYVNNFLIFLSKVSLKNGLIYYLFCNEFLSVKFRNYQVLDIHQV